MQVENDNRIGDWFVGFGGRRVWPFDLRADDFNIEMIAHSLSNICRFGGHCREFYSVAQHSLLVSGMLPDSLKLCGLLHDATEAMMGFDCPRPVKIGIPQIRVVEHEQWPTIAAKFYLPNPIPAQVKDADNVALLTERRDLLDDTGHRWGLEDLYQPAPVKITPVPPIVAKRLFLAKYEELTYVD